MALGDEGGHQHRFVTRNVAGAGLWEARKLLSHDSSAPNPEAHLVVIGFLTAAIAGLLAIRFMLAFLKKNPYFFSP